ncbi:MAG TPA: hypothetical protein VK911_17585 [Vicinamibacterales bacterium]|nr:hypothetical protein [Vicinamibacterales bacterium]
MAIRRCTTDADVQPLLKEADEISRMLTGFSRYLLRCDRKQRF